MRDHPHLYADEIRDRLVLERGTMVKENVIYYALKSMGITKKKCWVHPKEADILQEYEYCRHFQKNNYSLNQLVFFDESYIDRKNGYAVGDGH